MQNETNATNDQIADIPIIDFTQIPEYPGKKLVSPETLVMFCGMIVTYLSLKNGWNLPAISEQVQLVDGQVIAKVNQYHQLILAIILAIINGGTFSYAKGKNDERRDYYRVVDRGIQLRDRVLAIRQLNIERELVLWRKLEREQAGAYVASSASAVHETVPEFHAIQPKKESLP